MRTFHTTWFAFFLAFFGWFGIAPLMAIIREDLILTKAEIGNTIIASVAITVLVRVLIGPLCDKIGSRKAYTWLLILGSLPVMGIGLAQNYETFLLFRLAIGAIGASFVITQYHTSVMFAPNCVGTANATTAGWGNLGGGVTQMVMPLIFTAVLSFGVDRFLGWRLAMIVPGIALFITGFVYYFFTQDAPDGNYKELRERGELEPAKGKGMESFMLASDTTHYLKVGLRFRSNCGFLKESTVLLSLHPQAIIPNQIGFIAYQDAGTPACKMFIAALMSLSWSEPHSGHVHCLSESESLSFVYPQSEQGLVVACQRPAFAKTLPYLAHVHSRMTANSPKAMSEILRPQRRFIPSRLSVSMAILSYLRTSRSANLKNQSRRLAAICLWTRARWRFARYQPLDGYCLPESALLC